MEEQFVPYELALKLKELGFNEVCLANYNNLTEYTRLLLGKTDEGCITWNKTPDKYNTIINSNERILAPLWQQAFDWFRRKYNLISWVYKTNIDTYYFSILRKDRYLHDLTVNCVTYEESRLECLKKLIELVESKKDSV